MILSPGRYLARFATFAVLVAALGLAACGRKGPLELPASAATTQPAGASGQPGQTAQGQPVAVDAQGRPIPQGERKSFILDGLLN